MDQYTYSCFYEKTLCTRYLIKSLKNTKLVKESIETLTIFQIFYKFYITSVWCLSFNINNYNLSINTTIIICYMVLVLRFLSNYNPLDNYHFKL